jgi:hypothetical protein
MTTIEEQEEVPIWQLVLEFAAHVIGGAAMFVLLATPAAGCDLILQWLHSMGISRIVSVALQFGKCAILFVDVVFFCLFLGVSADKPFRRCIKRLKRGTWQ